jgi:hypothetical protein
MTIEMTHNPSQAVARNGDSRIARGLIVLVISIILAGFAKNFYLRAWLGSRPLIVTAWIHGIVMTAWLALFVTQATMVSRGRVDLHRKFGEWSVWLAVAVVAIGIATILVRARLAHPDATALMSATVFVALDGLSLLLFGALVALAWRYRFRPAIHRRLMVMAMVALLPPAFGRLVAYLRHDHIEIIAVGLMIVTTLIFVTVDALRSHRLQRASWCRACLSC